MTEPKPKPGQWYFQMSGFVPMGAFDSREEAERVGRERATKIESRWIAVGKWKATVEAGTYVEFIKLPPYNEQDRRVP